MWYTHTHGHKILKINRLQINLMVAKEIQQRQHRHGMQVQQHPEDFKGTRTAANTVCLASAFPSTLHTSSCSIRASFSSSIETPCKQNVIRSHQNPRQTRRKDAENTGKVSILCSQPCHRRHARNPDLSLHVEPPQTMIP